MMYFFFIFLFSSAFYLFSCGDDKSTLFYTEIEAHDKLYNRMKLKAKEALSYCESENFNTDYCILIDMSIHSGLNRFFVWDFKTDTISKSFLVSHGCGENPWSADFSKENPNFSNEDGSHCSSLGKYKIGQRAYSNWGIHIKYVLHGLEKTNSNALSRYVVFHSWEEVSNEEIYPSGTPEGWGCPTISNENFQLLAHILQKSKKPVLLWVYL